MLGSKSGVSGDGVRYLISDDSSSSAKIGGVSSMWTAEERAVVKARPDEELAKESGDGAAMESMILCGRGSRSCECVSTHCGDEGGKGECGECDPDEDEDVCAHGLAVGSAHR